MIAQIFLTSFTIKRATKLIQIGLLLLFAAALSACGGGSSDSSATTTAPILVNAGNDITLNEAQTANIVGGSSGGNGVSTYAWQSGNDEVQITHPDTALTNAVLTAPAVTQVRRYTITLVATDETGAQQSDTFTLTVNPVNLPPNAIINANQITGYANQTYPATSIISLNGSNSTDDDPQNAQAPISSYLWQQIAGPSMIAGVDSSQSSIELVAPVLTTAQTAIFRLTVTDQEQAGDSQDISLNLLAESSTIPSASVNTVRDVFAGELVKLSGSAQSIAPNAGPFSASWSNDAGSQINNSESFTTYAIAPLVDTTTTVNYALAIEDNFRNTQSAQTSAQVYAPATRYLNDTGVTIFADQDSLLSVYQTDFAGQDADYGADRQTLSGQVIKVGDGEAGFDFTRLDSNGDAIDNPSFAFSCVRDNVTGLIWQVKNNTDSTNIEYVDQTFTWFSEDANGNFEGALNENSNSCNVSTGQCNTQAYVEQINAQGICGFSDWRVPAVQELQSIIHYGKTASPLVDLVFFPYWGDNNSQALWYWTNQTSADGVSNDIARNAWAIDMDNGNDGFLAKTSEQRLILVRAGR